MFLETTNYIKIFKRDKKLTKLVRLNMKAILFQIKI
jgi:hypothetical protein